VVIRQFEDDDENEHEDGHPADQQTRRLDRVGGGWYDLGLGFFCMTLVKGQDS